MKDEEVVALLLEEQPHVRESIDFEFDIWIRPDDVIGFVAFV